jgi:hypothetical protein
MREVNKATRFGQEIFTAQSNPGPGLPDGLFSYQKSKYGQFLEGLAMEDVGIFYGQPFGIF